MNKKRATKLKKAFATIKAMLPQKKKSVFGPRIFQARTWLDKEVEDAIWKKQFNLD
jgi:hypothetical protein